MSTGIGSFAAGGAAAVLAVLCTHPFESVKIKLQLQGELQAKKETRVLYRGVFHGVGVVAKNDGIRGLYRGIGAGCIYQIALNGARLSLYEPLRKQINSLILTQSFSHSHDTSITNRQLPSANVIAGATSGVIGAAAGSPFFLVKTRLQSFSPSMPVGMQHHYRNAWDGLTQIYRKEGVVGLYRGIGPAMVRTACGSSVQLPTYFLAKRTFQKHGGMADGTPLHLLSSTCSGFVVCIAMNPMDVIMSRMYNQDGSALYKSGWDCIKKTIKTEGITALYKGFGAHLARILPHTILTLTFAEQTNKLMRKLEDRILPERMKEKI